jgi:UDP-sulfoquinovose synthase
MKFVVSIFIAVLPVATSFQVPLSTSAPRLSTLALNAEPNGSSGDKKKVIVLGGDGFCGWPTSLYLSDQGHDVVIVDNLSRRNIDIELGCDSLTPICSPQVS